MNRQDRRYFGHMVRRAREALQLPLGRVASALEISIPYLSDIERGMRAPLAGEKLEKLCEVLRLNVEEVKVWAASWQGFAGLDFGVSQTHADTGASLMRVWAALSKEELDGIMRIIEAKDNAR